MRPQNFGSSEVTQLLSGRSRTRTQIRGLSPTPFPSSPAEAETPALRELRRNSCLSKSGHSLTEGLGGRLDSKTHSVTAVYGFKPHQFPPDSAIFHFIPKTVECAMPSSLGLLTTRNSLR